MIGVFGGEPRLVTTGQERPAAQLPPAPSHRASVFRNDQPARTQCFFDLTELPCPIHQPIAEINERSRRTQGADCQILQETACSPHTWYEYEIAAKQIRGEAYACLSLERCSSCMHCKGLGRGLALRSSDRYRAADTYGSVTPSAPVKSPACDASLLSRRT